MTDYSHAEIKELLGAYALDAVDGDEQEAVELHLRECPWCRAEVADHREVASLIGHGGAPAPEGVWDRIVAAIEPAPPQMRLELRAVEPEADVPVADPVVVPFEPPAARRGAGWSWRQGAMVAAAVLVVAALAGVILHLEARVNTVQSNQASAQLSQVAAEALVQRGGHQAVLTGAAGHAKLTAVVTKDGQGYLLAASTPKLDAAHTYQLWGVVDRKVISLGEFPGQTKVVPFAVDPNVSALAITEEVAGGVVVSHNKALYSATI